MQDEDYDTDEHTENFPSMQDEDYDTDEHTENFPSVQQEGPKTPDEDPDEDLYEETTHKVIYRRSSLHQEFSRDEDEEEHRTSSKSNPFSQSSERIQQTHDWSGRDLPDRPSRSWPERPEKYDQRITRTRKSDESSNYYAVAKWEVDYSNQNYIRSKLNKPGGFHRYSMGKPLDWDIEYDNTYYLRSQINEPKGYHRHKVEIKRKRVPDPDPLADSTGWELEYGPEFNQQEGDVPYMPEERMISRGAYRCYGVRRNNSDSDRKIEEKQLDFREISEENLKYGPEFLQKDVQHILKQKDKRIGRGGYRHYDAERNKYDERPEDPPGVQYRESRATLGEPTDESDDEKDFPKGKPFKRTILKKIVKLGKPISVENARYGTHLKFTPGEGSQTFYEGKPMRRTGSQAQYSSGAGSRVFYVGHSSQPGYTPKKNRNTSAFKTTKKSNYSRRTPTEASERKGRRLGSKDYWNEQSSYGAKTRRQDDRNYSSKTTHRMQQEDEETMDEKKVLKKFPPDVEERIYTIRKRMSRPEIQSGKEKNLRTHHTHEKSHKGGYKKKTRSHGKDLTDYTDMDDIDFRRHLKHPRDHGKSLKGGYEKYVNDNGSEIWVKTEDSYMELHHL